MRSILKRILFRPGTRPRRLLGGSLKGYQFQLDLRADTQVWRGIYEIALQNWIDRVTIQGNTCLDIGAADGYFSLLLALRAGPSGIVHSFQPGEQAELIASNFTLNHAKALAPCIVHRAFVVGRSNANQKCLQDDGGDKHIVIDDLVDQGVLERVDVVKLDVDGGEVDVLQGMQRTLTRFKPHLFVEVHSEKLLSEVRAVTEAHGYEMRLESPPRYEHRPIAFNAFFFSVSRPGRPV